MKEIIKRYTNDEVTVVWQPAKCIHAKKCAEGLPKVFNPNNRPWIQLDHADNEEIIEQVKACPSGALSLETQQETNTMKASETKITVADKGPLLVDGKINLTLSNGDQIEKEGITALCRCGASKNKPYCDGSHNDIEFDT